MKKYLFILCITLFSCSNAYKHECIDETHRDCDGACICDGMKCPKPKRALQFVNAYDYQLDISSIPDSIIVMDGHRWVGTIPMWDKSPLDSLLMIDNE